MLRFSVAAFRLAANKIFVKSMLSLLKEACHTFSWRTKRNYYLYGRSTIAVWNCDRSRDLLLVLVNYILSITRPGSHKAGCAEVNFAWIPYRPNLLHETWLCSFDNGKHKCLERNATGGVFQGLEVLTFMGTKTHQPVLCFEPVCTFAYGLGSGYCITIAAVLWHLTVPRGHSQPVVPLHRRIQGGLRGLKPPNFFQIRYLISDTFFIAL